jgi:AmmeMemoRadiSam system protein B
MARPAWKKSLMNRTERVRKPFVAGSFYPAGAAELKKEISSFLKSAAKKEDALACILPHAGYMYSGRVACETAAAVNIKDKVVLLGPNHTGRGKAFSIMTAGAWETPLGRVKIDAALAKNILANSRHLEEDELAHIEEHSLEVELPILQYFKKDFTFVPIAFLSGGLTALKETGEDLAKTIKDSGLRDSCLIVASSDMTHYEPQKEAQEKDNAAIAAITALDEERLFKEIRRLDITMCGCAPVIVAIKAAKLLGAKAARLVRYQTSGDVTGDRQSVVGYAGITIN